MGADGLYSGVSSERQTGENQLPAAPAVLVALYTRVSTSDQNFEFQLRELQDYAAHQGWQVVEVYRVMLSWTSAYVKAITLGSNQVEANFINLRSGTTGASLTVLVSSAFGSISGTVSEGDRPAAGARIALVRDDFVSLGDVTFASTDNAGSYTIGNVRPGKYRIAVIEENDNAARSGNLDDYEDILARIEVQPKDKPTKDLKRRPPIK